MRLPRGNSPIFKRCGVMSVTKRARISASAGRPGAAATAWRASSSIAARLVQLSVSRQREYLADATAVEFTRNPAGLEGALWKIGTDREVLEVANRATQHLYIANPIKKFEERASSLFSTHPPLADRINRLRALHGGAPLSVEDMRPLAAME